MYFVRRNHIPIHLIHRKNIYNNVQYDVTIFPPAPEIRSSPEFFTHCSKAGKSTRLHDQVSDLCQQLLLVCENNAARF